MVTLQIINPLFLLLFFLGMIPLFIVVHKLRLGSLSRLVIAFLRMMLQLAELLFVVHFLASLQKTWILWLFLPMLYPIAAMHIGWRLWRAFLLEVTDPACIRNHHFWYFSWNSLLSLMASTLPIILIWLILFVPFGQWHISQGWLLFTAISLHFAASAQFASANHFIKGVLSKRKKIEAALALGLSPLESFQWLFQESIQLILAPILLSVSFIGLGQLTPFQGALLMRGLPLWESFTAQIALSLGMVLITFFSALFLLLLLFANLRSSFLPEKMNRKHGHKRKKRIRVR